MPTDYPTFTGDPASPDAPAIYRDAEGHIQARPLQDAERAKQAAWVAAAAREQADGTFAPADAEAPEAPAEAPVAPAKVKAAPATPDASGVIYVPGKVCPGPASAPAACGAGIERKPGAGRPPARCLACRAKDAAAAEAKAARKAAGK